MTIAWGVAALGLAVLCMRSWNPKPSELVVEGQEFASDYRAFVAQDFVPAMDRAHRADRRVGSALVMVFAATLVPLDLWLPSLDMSVKVQPLGTFLFLVLACWRLRIAGTEFPVPAGSGVVARPRRIAVSDYVAPWAQWTSRVLVGLCVLVAGGSFAVAQGHNRDHATALACCAGALMIAVTAVGLEQVCRAMCERSQSSVDANHLYFQDAWRGRFLQRAYFAMAFGAFAFLGGLASTLGVEIVDGILLLVVWAGGMKLFVESDHARLRFRQRLWPMLQPGAVLLPGQSVDPWSGAIT